MPRVHIGQASLQGHLERYAKTFDFVEIKSEPALLSPRALKRLAQQAPEGFSFSLVLPKKLSELAETPVPAALDAARSAAETLGARFVLVRTPASFAPSARSRARLARLVEGLRGKSAIAWEPRGIWTDEEIAACAAELELVAVRDLAEQEPAPGAIVYTRLLALGRNSRVGSAAIERVSERLEGAEEAFVIVEGQGAAGVARRLRGDLAPSAGPDADFDEDADEGEDDEFEDEEEAGGELDPESEEEE